MGQENSQSHTFECRNCHEPITIRLDVDYKNVATEVHCIQNCQASEEQPNAPIVNVHANFLIPESEQDKDFAFPHLQQMAEMFEAAEKAGRIVNVGKLSEQERQTRPFRRPDYAEEWKSLKKAWSLSRNGKFELSAQIIKKASGHFYAADPLEGLHDWLWRLSMFLCNPHFEDVFRSAFDEIKPLYGTPGFLEYSETYTKAAKKRGQAYFELMSEFFGGFSEFSQIYFAVSTGATTAPDFRTSSTDFNAVKMFYGNAYEQFANLIEYFAIMNNLLSGRKFDEFQQLTLDEYRKLDKSGRFNPFSKNSAFAAVCAEADNHIRNASHHGTFAFNPADQLIRYRSGKGGAGPEQEMSYATYLEKCVKIFLQAMTLFRIELMVAHHAKIQPPI